MQNMVRPNRPDLDATKVPTELDIAWAAGIFEGEGHCRLANRRGICATVVQKDPELLYRLREWFGGRVADNGKNIGIHVWECNGDRARIFLGLIYGWMTARRKVQIDATNALEYLGGKSPIGLNRTQLLSELESFYAAHKEAVRLRKKAAAKRAYERRYANAEYREAYLAKQRKSSAKSKNHTIHTPECENIDTTVKIYEMQKTA